MKQNAPCIQYREPPSRRGTDEVRFEVREALLFCRVGPIGFVTRHEIEHDKNGRAVALGAGAPVSAEALAELTSELQREDPVWIDENLLAIGGDRIVWWLPPERRPLWFFYGHQRKRLLAPWPGLVLVMERRGRLKVFATAGEARPKPGAVLYHAPLMNVHGNGELCFGGVEIPQYGAGNRQAYERALIDSRSTHVNHPRTLRRNKGATCTTEDHIRIWESLQGADKFPSKLLVKTSSTLQGLVERNDD